MNNFSSKSTGLIESCDNMKSTSQRKVKSLSDIPEVFQRNSHTGNESNIRRVSLLNVTSEQYGISERDTFPLQTIGFKRDNQRENHFSGTREFVDIYSINEEDTEKENVFQKLNVPEMNANNQIDSNAKSDPIDAIQVSDTLPEEKHLNATEEIKLRKVKRNLLVIDAFLASVIITPMTVGFWRGIWSLMDMYADIFPGVITFVLGILVHTIFAILKNLLHTRIIDASRKKACVNKTLWKSTQILYTYVFGAACNMQWRGGWIIFDHFFLDRTWKIITATSVAVITLAIFRSARNLISIPFVVAVDKLTYVFRFPTRYKLNTRDWSLYLLDCAFSVGVVGTLVVFVWRGVWILFDIYLFPEDREYSAIGSLAIGYAIVTVTFSLQPLMRYVCARLQGLARLIAADGFLLLSFLGTVNVWRGIWNVLDLWLVPDNPELSCWITHVGCFVFLVLLNCSNSILVRGVYIDGEEDDGKCVVFPCHYLRLFFKVEREKKEARRRNLLVASKDFRPRPDGNTKDTENGALLPNSNTTTILPTNPESLV